MAENGRLRIALAQVNTTVGDVDGNAALVAEWIARARDTGAQLVVFPEQTLNGYPSEDLVLRGSFLRAGVAALQRIAADVDGIAALVGFAEPDSGVRNSLAVLADRGIRGVYRKVLLPNYGVFDERRYFEPGDRPALLEVNGMRLGLTVCEDIWFPGPPASVEALAGASLIVNASASPYHRGKGAFREGMLAERAAETGAAFAMCNLVGGQDELVFDGHSLVVSAAGEVVARAPQFEEQLVVCDLELPVDEAGSAIPDAGLDSLPGGPPSALLAGLELAARPAADPPAASAAPLDDDAEVYAALVLGVRDYVRKNGFERVLLALSGGIDSALVALIAADALGPEGLCCVVMSSYDAMLASADGRGADGRDETGAGGPEAASDLTAENIQARIRGNLIRALSNRHGWLVLTTGNKSEMSVGYATLYGDMAGGFAVLKDVPKTLVYRLVRHRNEVAGRELVPASVLERAPSAELRPGQRDDDSLPPYELLDRILELYVQSDRGRDQIVDEGIPEDVVDEVMTMVDRSEYKRRQAPPGIKITPKAFGRDRRLPITNRFRG